MPKYKVPSTRFVIQTIPTSPKVNNRLNTEQSAEVLQNPLILSSILSLLPNSDLLSCRLVCPTWSSLSTPILSKGLTHLDIRMEYTSDFKTYCKISPLSPYQFLPNFLSLKKLYKLLKYPSTTTTISTSVPPSSILFHNFTFDGGDLGEGKSMKFFTLHGHLIKTLSLLLNTKERAYTSKSTLLNLLTLHCPNVESLTIFSVPSQWTHFNPTRLSSASSNLLLQNLKSVRIADSMVTRNFSFMSSILTKAVNLENLYIFPVDSFENNVTIIPFNPKWTSFYKDCGKLHTVKELLFTGPGPSPLTFNEDDWDVEDDDHETEEWVKDHLDCIQEFVDYIPSIESLTHIKFTDLTSFDLEVMTLDDLDRKLNEQLSTILKRNKDTLTKLTIGHVLGHRLTQVKWPVMKNVQKLDFNLPLSPPYERMGRNRNGNGELQRIQVESILPPNLDCNSIFPHLTSVTFSRIEYEDASLDNENPEWAKWFPFPESSVFQSVKTLIVNFTYCPVSWMNLFPAIFPNVEKLYLVEISDFPAISRSGLVWRGWPELRWLHLDLYLTEKKSKNFFPGVDATLTGLDEKLVRWYASQVESTREEDGGELEKRSNSNGSLVDLKMLEYLRIEFSISDDKTTTNEKSSATALFSYFETRASEKKEEKEEGDVTKLVMSKVVTEYGFNLSPCLNLVDICYSIEDSNSDEWTDPEDRDFSICPVNHLKRWRRGEPPFQIAMKL